MDLLPYVVDLMLKVADLNLKVLDLRSGEIRLSITPVSTWIGHAQRLFHPKTLYMIYIYLQGGSEKTPQHKKSRYLS